MTTWRLYWVAILYTWGSKTAYFFEMPSAMPQGTGLEGDRSLAIIEFFVPQ